MSFRFNAKVFSAKPDPENRKLKTVVLKTESMCFTISGVLAKTANVVTYSHACECDLEIVERDLVYGWADVKVFCRNGATYEFARVVVTPNN